MKVKTVTRFKDLEANKIREPGEEFEVNSKRAEKLINLELVVPVIVNKQIAKG